MTARKKKIETRGKPLGYRANKTLHGDIVKMLDQDKANGGDGMTIAAISQALGQNFNTTKTYIADLRQQELITQRTIAGTITLYRPVKKAKTNI
jgi:hypothetical protein